MAKVQWKAYIRQLRYSAQIELYGQLNSCCNAASFCIPNFNTSVTFTSTIHAILCTKRMQEKNVHARKSHRSQRSPCLSLYNTVVLLNCKHLYNIGLFKSQIRYVAFCTSAFTCSSGSGHDCKTINHFYCSHFTWLISSPLQYQLKDNLLGRWGISFCNKGIFPWRIVILLNLFLLIRILIL